MHASEVQRKKEEQSHRGLRDGAGRRGKKSGLAKVDWDIWSCVYLLSDQQWH